MIKGRSEAQANGTPGVYSWESQSGERVSDSPG